MPRPYDSLSDSHHRMNHLAEVTTGPTGVLRLRDLAGCQLMVPYLEPKAHLTYSSHAEDFVIRLLILHEFIGRDVGIPGSCASPFLGPLLLLS